MLHDMPEGLVHGTAGLVPGLVAVSSPPDSVATVPPDYVATAAASQCLPSLRSFQHQPFRLLCCQRRWRT